MQRRKKYYVMKLKMKLQKIFAQVLVPETNKICVFNNETNFFNEVYIMKNDTCNNKENILLFFFLYLLLII